MDYKDEQINEIEALDSIYCGEMESKHGEILVQNLSRNKCGMLHVP